MPLRHGIIKTSLAPRNVTSVLFCTNTSTSSGVLRPPPDLRMSAAKASSVSVLSLACCAVVSAALMPDQTADGPTDRRRQQ